MVAVVVPVGVAAGAGVCGFDCEQPAAARRISKLEEARIFVMTWFLVRKREASSFACETT